MPIKDGSILSAEYTETIKEIHQNLNKAKELYNSLPPCIINRIRELHELGETLPYCLNKGITAIKDIKEDYGIK